MPDQVIINSDNPVEPVEEETTWQSVLSEVRTAILEGFSSLRQEMENQRLEGQNRESRLMESNTQLTQQITQANQTLMEKLSSLTSIQSTPEIVVVEEVIPESVAEESPVAETTELEAPVAEVENPRRKRRIL